MGQTVAAHFDGRVFVPDEPVRLAAGQSVRLYVETSVPETPQFAELPHFSAAPPDATLDPAGGHGPDSRLRAEAQPGGPSAVAADVQGESFGFGLHEGLVTVSDDFDAPLPDTFWLGEAES